MRCQRTSNGFARRYTNADIQLIATLDNLHDQPNGKALKKLCERAYRVYGESAYERLSTISVAHLYNLRKSKVYTRCRYTYTKTKPKASTIGERRKPCPYGQPGYLRIDSVHQGDLDWRKGGGVRCECWVVATRPPIAPLGLITPNRYMPRAASWGPNRAYTTDTSVPKAKPPSISPEAKRGKSGSWKC